MGQMCGTNVKGLVNHRSFWKPLICSAEHGRLMVLKAIIRLN